MRLHKRTGRLSLDAPSPSAGRFFSRSLLPFLSSFLELDLFETFKFHRIKQTDRCRHPLVRRVYCLFFIDSGYVDFSGHDAQHCDPERLQLINSAFSLYFFCTVREQLPVRNVSSFLFHSTRFNFETFNLSCEIFFCLNGIVALLGIDLSRCFAQFTIMRFYCLLVCYTGNAISRTYVK